MELVSSIPLIMQFIVYMRDALGKHIRWWFHVRFSLCLFIQPIWYQLDTDPRQQHRKLI